MQKVIKSVKGDVVNLEKIGIFYNKENQKANYLALTLARSGDSMDRREPVILGGWTGCHPRTSEDLTDLPL